MLPGYCDNPKNAYLLFQMPFMGAELPSWEQRCDSQSKEGRALVYADLPDTKPAAQRGRLTGLKPQTGLSVALGPDGSCGHWFYTVSIRLLSNLTYAMTHSGKSILDQELSMWRGDGRGSQGAQTQRGRTWGVRTWEGVKSHNGEKHYLQEHFLLLKFPQGLRRMEHTKSE